MAEAPATDEIYNSARELVDPSKKFVRGATVAELFGEGLSMKVIVDSAFKHYWAGWVKTTLVLVHLSTS